MNEDAVSGPALCAVDITVHNVYMRDYDSPVIQGLYPELPCI